MRTLLKISAALRLILPLFVLWSWANIIHAQTPDAFPTVKQILGYELGERFTTHDGVEKFLFALRDAAKQRMRLIPYGESYEHRTLYLAVFSSPENLARLDDIKANIHKLADPRVTSASDADNIAKSSPAIAWLSYDVHGNEASAAEAALSVMYGLASRNDSEVTNLLNKLVIVVDPLLNPDGHERYVHYEASKEGVTPVEDKNGVEHNEDWPSGRTNHYLFDLNRDWSWLTQQESRARIKAYEEWKPQVHVDYHEMSYNSSYFFFPAFKPINRNFPKNTLDWAEIFGKANAAAFDAKGLNYYSGEEFDLYYPGYGDSWPSLNGAIGMTYEQAGQTGLRVHRADDAILTLKDRLEHHALSSWATLNATAQNKEKRLRDFYQFFKDAIDEGKTGPVRAYIVDPTADPMRAAKMVSILRQEGAEVQKATSSFSLGGLKTYFTPGEVSKTFPAGSYVIPLDQPSKRLISALMEPEPALSDTFFYDISSWSLPVAYGVPTYWSATVPGVATEKLTGEEEFHGQMKGGKATYAYLLKSGTNAADRALAFMLQHGMNVHIAMKDFTSAGQKFDRGTLIVPVAGNPADTYEQLNGLAQQLGVDFYSANTGYTEEGIKLGSDRAVKLKKPKIIVVTGAPVNTEAYGAIWAMFDQQYGIQFVPMKVNQLRSADLHDYTTMVFPDDGREGRGYKSVFDSDDVDKIKTWIEGGGTFIGIEGGAAFASASVGKIAHVKIKEKEKKKEDAKKDSLSAEDLEKRMTVEQKEHKERLEEIPGTIVRVRMDPSHPLGFGYDTSLAVLKQSSTMFELTDNGYNVGIYPKSPRLSGYMSKENEKKLEETAYLVHEQLGGGNIVLFADDPNFRLFWDGLNRLFLNSVLIMPGIHNVMLTSGEEER